MHPEEPVTNIEKRQKIPIKDAITKLKYRAGGEGREKKKQ